MKAQESYHVISTAFHDILQEVNILSDRGNIEVQGSQYKIEMYLGGDYKVDKL